MNFLIEAFLSITFYLLSIFFRNDVCIEARMIQPDQFIIKDNGIFPGSRLPVLHYKAVLIIPVFFAARQIKQRFKENDWTNTWRDGVYAYDHYHSNTHETMAVIKGQTRLLLGGENGQEIVLQKGDVIVIPAGVAHRNLGKMKDVICIGSYPGGRNFDMNYGKAGERPKADQNISKLELPDLGPLYGINDPLLKIWKKANLKSLPKQKNMNTTKNKKEITTKTKKSTTASSAKRKTPLPGQLGHIKENPKDGNIGKNNAGGYK
jgi:uncharacterized protein YjlB